MLGTNVIYNLDCLDGLLLLPDNSVDLVLTDPPYSSGGTHTTTRKQSTKEKYTDEKFDGAASCDDFAGDNMDQRSWTAFMRMVLKEARRVTKPEGIAGLFCDWRQLPALSDALQAAGWTWRGVVVWDKRSARPQKGRFTNQCEYLVWGSNGAMPFERGVPPLRGVYTEANVPTAERLHQTQKPVDLMCKLLEIVPAGSVVLDPFAGSGTTGAAAIRTGRRFILLEGVKSIYETAKQRIEEELAAAEAQKGENAS